VSGSFSSSILYDLPAMGESYDEVKAGLVDDGEIRQGYTSYSTSEAVPIDVHIV
jgi:predicted RecB family endonuclease